MADTNPRGERTGERLTFASGASSNVALLFGVAFLVTAVIAFATDHRVGEAVVAAFFAAILLIACARRSILEIDLATCRLRLTRQFLNLWARTIVDCPFDQCRALGVIMYNAEGRISCGAYFQLKNSQRHAIPFGKMTSTEITALVRDLSAETGIPFEETPMVEIT